MIEGSCHCGKVRWQFDGVPERATACSCTVCRRSGALWAHDYENEAIRVSGETQVYLQGDREIGLHFCRDCGCVVYVRTLALNGEGRRRMGVNLRMAEQGAVSGVPIRRFDGFGSWEEVPADGRTVGDVWF
jgi:hypothetical protein